MLGPLPDGHVVELLRPRLGPEVLSTDGLQGCADGGVVRVAGRVARRQRPLAAVVFLTLEELVRASSLWRSVRRSGRC